MRRMTKSTSKSGPMAATRKQNNNCEDLSPLVASSPSQSPSLSVKRKMTTTCPAASPFSLSTDPVSTFAELSSAAVSGVESLKRHVDSCHSDVLKDLEASRSRISKRYKIQSQATLKILDNVDKECKKISDKIKENTVLMKKSYAETMAATQSSASRVFKAIPEIELSVEKVVSTIRTRYKLSAA